MIDLTDRQFLPDKKPVKVAIHTNPIAIQSPPNKRQKAALAKATKINTTQRDIRGCVVITA